MSSTVDASIFTAVQVVTREAFAVHGATYLPHVGSRIDAYLNTLSGPWAVEIACYRGDSVRKLSYLAAHDLTTFWRPAAMWAAMRGHIHVLQWLLDHHSDRCEWSVGVMDDAARCSQLFAVQWLHVNRSEGCTFAAMTLAATGGDLDMVKWLHAHRHEGCSTRAMDLAAKNGHLAVVRWLHENRSEGCSTDAMDYAALKGDLEMVEWLHCNRREGCTTGAMINAASSGQLLMVRWLCSNRRDSHTGHALEAAARNGHLAVVQFLYASRGEHTSESTFVQDAIAMATLHGHEEVVEWLLQECSQL